MSTEPGDVASCGPDLFAGAPTLCTVQNPDSEEAFCFCGGWTCGPLGSGCSCGLGGVDPDLSCEGAVCCLETSSDIAWCSCGSDECGLLETPVSSCSWDVVHGSLSDTLVDSTGDEWVVVDACEAPTVPTGNGGSGPGPDCANPGLTWKNYCENSDECGPVLTCMKPCPSCAKSCNLPCGGDGGGDELCASYGAGTCPAKSCSECFPTCNAAPTTCGP